MVLVLAGVCEEAAEGEEHTKGEEHEDAVRVDVSHRLSGVY